ncbi:MAG: alkaline phosphatase family protein [Candidatus Baltobacteraceae bacterium]
MRPRAAGLFVFALIAGAEVIACSGPPQQSANALLPMGRTASGSTPIAHVIVVIQENRSFDNLFATFPGADGATTGQAEAVPPSLQSQCPIPKATTVPLQPHDLVVGDDFDHSYQGGYLIDLDGGKMDGFDLSVIPGGSGKLNCLRPYQYVNPQQIKPYWDLASQYVLADQTFQTQGSGTFTAHQDLIAGGTMVDANDTVIDNPTYFPWGCDSRSSTVTSLITTSGQYLQNQGPFPCFTYQTLRDLLDARHVAWKYYAMAVQKPSACKGKGGDTAGIWSAFDAIQAVRYGPEWRKNVTKTNTVFFKDVSSGKLPAVSWITPDAINSDHPQEQKRAQCQPGHGPDLDTGPSWVASIVNAVGESKYWNSSAIVILWDDWGGFYDHESPAFFDNMGGLGFRVPMLIVSPYVQAHVEHTQYEYGSILKFVENNWNLGSLHTTDDRAASIANAFDFNQQPRQFQPIGSKYSRSYFLHQKPSGVVPDSQ